MMTSSNWNIFRVTGHLCGEFTDHQWIPLTKASNAELWCFLWSAPWINGWVNNGEAGDLRRHRAHYDVIVMVIMSTISMHFNGACEVNPTTPNRMTLSHKYKYSLLMRGIKMESPVQIIFEWKTSIDEWVYPFSIYELLWNSKDT